MIDRSATDLCLDRHRNIMVFNLLREFQLFDGCLMGLAAIPLQFHPGQNFIMNHPGRERFQKSILEKGWMGLWGTIGVADLCRSIRYLFKECTNR
jgi:hypothetical protein